jgi:hypothetical protein
MATKKIKINFKMPTPTAAERLHTQQQKNRKAAGLPDPSEYKKKLDSMKSEEVEQLDEISPQLKASYVAGAKKQIKQSLPFTKKTDEYRDIAKNFIAKRQKGIAKASKVEEQLEKKGRFVSGPVKQPYKSGTIVTSVKESFRIGGMGSRGANVHMYDRNPGPKDGSELENVPFHAKTEKQKKLQNALNDLGKKMKETHPKLKEDYDDPITIIKKGTNIKKKISADAYDVFKHHGFRKEAKDSQEYDYEGDMAKSDLRSIIHNAQTLHDMLDDNTNLAEWCQSKITLAEDYISTVTNYMRSEMNEETIEEDKNDYQRKIEKNNKNFIAASKRQKNPLTNVHTAQTKQKPVKEDVEQLDEKKNLPGLWANIRAKRARGESPAKPGDKDYPKTLNIESTHDVPFNKPYNKDSGTTTDKSGAKHTPMSKARHLARQAMSKTKDKPVKESASEPTEGEIKGKQGYSRKAKIVMGAAKGKKSDSPDKFQKDPELSSEIHKT